MSHPPTLENQLDLVEQQFDKVSAALLAGDALALQSACAGLQQATVAFVQIRNTPGDKNSTLTTPLGRRVKALSSGFAQVRDGLHRRSALVDRTLQVVVPSMEKASTYAGESAPYGNAMRKSGAFRVVSA